MSTLTASNVAISARLPPPVITDGRITGWNKLTVSSHVHMRSQFRPVDYGRMKLCMQISSDRRQPNVHATRMQSASSICAAAFNARCSAVQTLPDTKRSPTITNAPSREGISAPHIDNGGDGLPPRDDGGGGGGGGGGNWWGGFFFFGFLVFLSFLKDQESEGDYKEYSKPRPEWL